MAMRVRVMKMHRWACVGGGNGRRDRVRRRSDWRGRGAACGVEGTGQREFGS